MLPLLMQLLLVFFFLFVDAVVVAFVAVDANTVGAAVVIAISAVVATI